MANLSDSIFKLPTPISIKHLKFRPHCCSFIVPVSHCLKVHAAPSPPPPPSSRDDFNPHLRKKLRKAPRAPRRLITISTSSGRWQGQWSCDYVFSLRELQLADLAEDGEKDAEVFVSLTVQKHTGFGFSVDGRIITSFSRKCSCCFSSYCREVIYVQPGSDADLDSLIQDTVRLTASGKDTCSESCEKSPVIWQYTDGKMSYDQRWSRLLEIKNAM